MKRTLTASAANRPILCGRAAMATCSLLAAAPWLAGAGCGGTPRTTIASQPRALHPKPTPPNLSQYVDPFIGTDDSSSPNPVSGGAGGSVYPGAVVPFGMVQFSPDTPTASPSGYRYSDTEIEQFSLTHFNGAGCANNEDLPILPFVGPIAESPGTHWRDYRSAYEKRSEAASPGYYRVDLTRAGIRSELTATTRTGFARFVFPDTTAAQLLIQPGRAATGTRPGRIEIVGRNRLQGWATGGGFCGSRKTFRVYFTIVFDRDFRAQGTWLDNTIVADARHVQGVRSGAYVSFDTTANPVVQMKVAISYVSTDNAALNLATENPSWDFDAVRSQAQARWNAILNRVLVEGGSQHDRTKFYTALYRVFLNPNVANDVNGQYMGSDRSVHTTKRPMYQNFSGWDIIRSWTHLMAAIAPEASDIVHSMVQSGVEAGLLPFWSHQHLETRVMVGDPGTVNVANAYAMGVRGFDTAAALELMKKSASDPKATHRHGLSAWLREHYLDNAAISLEYAMADFALSQFARALGDTSTHQTYLARSDWWKASWNAADGYIRPRGTRAGSVLNAARIYELQVYGPDAPTENLALGASATASGSCNNDEGPAKAVNGTWKGGSRDKWCDNSSTRKWLRIDLGAKRRIDKLVLHHAGAGGESESWNTREFSLDVSADGLRWTTADTVVGNASDATTHTIKPVRARFVRLRIQRPTRRGASPGAWDCQPFDPASECGFIEGNAAQYVWMVPHNLGGLFELMGGPAAAVARLDTFFTELNAGLARPYFYVGNEPVHATPWSYNFAGVPWKTQRLVRRIVDEEFSTKPGGLPGNDDLGATSAWLLWAYLGLYPVIPGSDVLVIHGPSFPSVTLRLANARVLTIRGHGAGPSAPFVRTVRLNGQRLA